MDHRVNKCSNQCQDHRFAIAGQESDCLDCQLKLCPRETKGSRQNTFPEFNHDRKEFTSAFILGVDRTTLQNNENQQLEQHLRQIRGSLQQNLALLFPRPREVNKTCFICKEDFTDYFMHIVSEEHKLKILQNTYSSFLVELSKQFRALHGKEVPSPFEILREEGEEKQNSSSQADFESEEVKREVKDEESSDEVEIIQVRPAKMKTRKVREANPSSKEKKIKKKHKKEKKDEKDEKKQKKEKKKSKKQKKSKKEKKSKKGKKSKKKSKKQVQERDSDSEDQARRKNSLKRRPLDPPPSNPPWIHKKMTYRGIVRAAHPADLHDDAVLIEKSVLNKPVLPEQMQKVLKGVINSISREPPAEAPRQYRRSGDFMDNRRQHTARTITSRDSGIFEDKRYPERDIVGADQIRGFKEGWDRQSRETGNSLSRKPGTLLLEEPDEGTLSETTQFQNGKADVPQTDFKRELVPFEFSGSREKVWPMKVKAEAIKSKIYSPDAGRYNPQLVRKVMAFDHTESVIIDSSDEDEQKEGSIPEF